MGTQNGTVAQKRIARDVPQRVLDVINTVDFSKLDPAKIEKLAQDLNGLIDFVRLPRKS